MMFISRIFRFLIPVILFCLPVAIQAQVTWIGGSGIWHDGANWSSGQIPNASTDVVVNLTTGTVTITDDARAQSLTFDGDLVIASNASLDVDSAAVISGTWNHSGVFIGGEGTVITSDLTFLAGSIGGNEVRLSGNVELAGTEDARFSSSAVIIDGTFTHSGSGNLLVNNSTRVTIDPEGVYRFTAPSLLSNSGIGAGFSPILNNFGTIERSGIDGLAEVTITYNSTSATLNVSHGTLRLSGRGECSNATYNATGDGIIDLSPASDHDFAGNFSGTGDGQIILTMGQLDFDTDSTINFPMDYFDVTGGLITGPVSNLGHLTFSGDGQKRISSTFFNEGFIHVRDNGRLDLDNSSSLTNRASGEIIIYDGGTISRSAVGAGSFPFINNEGIVRKVNSTANSTIGPTDFNHIGGTIDVQTGTLFINSDGSSTGGFFNVAMDAVLDLSPTVDHIYTGTYTGSGDGEVRLVSGTMDFRSESEINFPMDYFVVTGGLVSGPVTNSGHVTFAGSQNKRINSTFTNDGTIHLRDNGFIALDNTTNLNNTLTGEIIIYDDGGITRSALGAGSSPVVNHEGLLLKAGGIGNSLVDVSIFNHLNGTVDIQSGTLSLSSDGVSTGATFNVSTGAVLDLSPASDHQYTGTYTGSGAGEIRLVSGTMDFRDSAIIDFPLDYFVMTGGMISGPVTNINHITFAGIDNKRINTSFTNDGTINLRDGGLLAIDNSTSLNNSESGLFLIHDDGGIARSFFGAGSFPVVDNEGLFEKIGGVGNSIIDITTFNHLNGMIEVQTGILSLSSHGVSTGGTFNVATDAVLDLSPTVDHIYTGTYTGSGDGEVRLVSGTMDFRSESEINFPMDYFVVTGGLVSGPVTNSGHVTFAGSQNKRINNTFTNDGTINLRDIGFIALDNTTNLNNTLTGEIIIYDDGGITRSALGAGSSPVVNHEGLLLKAGGIGNSLVDVSIFNHLNGTVDIQSGMLSLTSDGSSTGATFNVSSGSVLDLSPASDHLYRGTYTGSGGGEVRLVSGTMDFRDSAIIDFPLDYFVMTGGMISGPVTNINHITFAGIDNKRINTSFTNDGTINLRDGGLLAIDNSTSLNNSESGLFLIHDDGGITRSGFGAGFSPIVNNEGILRKSGGTGSSIIDVTFLNHLDDIVDLQTGNLTISSDGESIGSTITVAEGSVLDISPATNHIYDEGIYTGSGGGTVVANSGFLQGTGFGTFFDFEPGMLQLSSVQISNMTNRGEMTFVPAENQTRISGLFTNDGDMLLTSGTVVGLDSSGRIVNRKLIELQGDSTELIHSGFGFGFFPILENDSFIRRTDGDGEATLGLDLKMPYTTLSVEQGSLRMTGGGDWTSPNIFIADGNEITLEARAFNFDEELNPNGTGRVILDGGTLNGDGGTLEFDENQFIFRSGILNGVSGVANNGHILLEGGEPKRFGGNVYNAGTMINTGDGAISFGNLYNLDSGFFEVGGSPATLSGFRIENNGRIIKTGPGVMSSNFSAFIQSGELEITNGDLELINIDEDSFLNDSTIIGGRYIASGGTITFPDSVFVNDAKLEIYGSNSAFIDIDGLRTNNGTLKVSNGATASFANSLTNNGIIDIDETSSISLGSNYTGNSSSAVLIGITGNAATGTSGLLAVTGNAVFNGLFKLVPDNFNPQDDDRFPLITFASSMGTFSRQIGFESTPDLIVAPLYEPTEFVLVAENDAADLMPVFTSIPSMLVPGEPANIVYDLENNGTAPAEPVWRDSVYLSLDDQFDLDDILLTRIDQNSSINNGSSSPTNIDLDVPGILPGDYYIIVVADSRGEVLDFDRASNTTVSSTTVPLVWNQLTLGQFESGNFEPNRKVYYQFEAPALAALRTQLDTAANDGVVNAFLRANLPATTAEFDGAGIEESTDQDFSTAFFDDVFTNAGIDLQRDSEIGQRFIVLDPASLPNGNTTFDLLVEEEVFRLIGAEPAIADNQSSVTLKITGVSIPSAPDFILTNGNDSVPGEHIFPVSSDEIYATFDLTGLPAGSYRLESTVITTELIIDDTPDEPIFEIMEEEFTSALIDALQIVNTPNDNFIATVSASSRIRAGRNFDVIINYENAGAGDILAPVLVLASDQPVSFSNVTDGTSEAPTPVQLLGIAGDGPAGVLRPGSGSSIHLRGRAPLTEGPLQLQLFQLFDDGSQTTFRSFLDGLALNGENTTATLVQQQLAAEFGAQWNNYASVLANRATELSASGERVYGVSSLLEDVGLEVLNPTEFPMPLADGTPLDENPFDVFPSPAKVRTSVIQSKNSLMDKASTPQKGSGPDCDTDFLGKDRLLIQTAATGFTINGAINASDHLNNFLGVQTGFPPDCSQVNDIEYGPNSELAMEVREWTNADVSFNDVNLQYKQQVRNQLNNRLPNLTAGVSESTSFSVPDFNGMGLNVQPAKLSFYEKGYGGTFTPSTQNGSAFNLQAAFGGMQSAEGIIRDLEVEVEIIGECKIATYTGIIEYTWTDAYEFDADDVTKSTFDRAAACLVLNGLACNYATSITIQEPFNGRVVLEGDGENCDGSGSGPDEEEEPGEEEEPNETPPDEDEEPDDPDNDIPVKEEPEDTEETDVVRSTDPNDILGPSGLPDENFLRVTTTQNYIIRFENIATASAAAQEVFIDLPLDDDLDLSTFELVGYGFSGRDFFIQNNPSEFSGRVLLDDNDPNGLVVDLDVELDQANRIAHWTFTTLDPLTGDYPADPFAGFLPPNTAPPIGDGYVSFRINPKENLPSGTRIDAQASIIFDLNEAILTPPYFNTLDGDAPEAFFVTNSGSVGGTDALIEWDAEDFGGSGPGKFDVYVSENDGPLTLWLSQTPEFSATYTGSIGSTYDFAVACRDRLGYQQAAPVNTSLSIMLVEAIDANLWMMY